MRRLAAALTCASLLACSGPGEQPPQALRDYLGALEEGDLAAAYARTQLADIADAFGPGAAITEPHFVAAWERHPLTGYEITEVIELRKREIDDFGPGAAYYETMVELRTATSAWTENIGVEGAVIGPVLAGAYPVTVTGVARGARVEVDGVPLDVGPDPDGRLPLLLLGGRHEIGIDDARIELETQPLELVSGTARVIDPERGTIRLTSVP